MGILASFQPLRGQVQRIGLTHVGTGPRFRSRIKQVIRHILAPDVQLLEIKVIFVLAVCRVKLYHMLGRVVAA